MEKTGRLLIVLLFTFLCGVIVGKQNLISSPKVKLIQMTIEDNEFNERIIEIYHGKEVCVFAAELKNKKRKDDEGVYYCAE